MSELRHDLSQFYPMKAVMEEVFGRDTFLQLKESGTFADWKRECRRLLRALNAAINVNVSVVDDEWRREVKSVLDLGQRHLASARTITDLYAALAATLTRVTFLQLGALPNRYAVKSVSLAERYWRADIFRSVQYVQTEQQQRNLERSRKRKGKS